MAAPCTVTCLQWLLASADADGDKITSGYTQPPVAAVQWKPDTLRLLRFCFYASEAPVRTIKPRACVRATRRTTQIREAQRENKEKRGGKAAPGNSGQEMKTHKPFQRGTWTHYKAWRYDHPECAPVVRGGSNHASRLRGQYRTIR